jgi:hypothetical protein
MKLPMNPIKTQGILPVECDLFGQRMSGSLSPVRCLGQTRCFLNRILTPDSAFAAD